MPGPYTATRKNENMNIIEITDLSAPELAPYTRLTEAQLRNKLEPEKGIFIAESPKVIARALDKAKKEGGESVIDTVYLSLMSRKATAEEKALLQPIADNADATDRGDVLWTVLNTRQFFFIQ